MFRLWLEPAGEAGTRLEFDCPDRRFRERDRSMLNLLRPRFAQFRRNAQRRRRSSIGEAETLTPREREILELLAEGRTNCEVARLLCLSPGTIRKHLESTYKKLDVHTRTAAVAALRIHGIAN